MLTCPHCETSLAEEGSIILWSYIPNRSFAHLVLSESDGVGVIIDDNPHVDEPSMTVQCANCGEYLCLKIEEIEFEICDKQIEA